MKAGAFLAAFLPLIAARAAAGDLPVNVFAVAPGDEELTLLLLGPSRPALVRLRIQVDGQGYRARWDAVVRGMVPLFDGDGDGSLSRSEIARVDLLRLSLRAVSPRTTAGRATGTASDRFDVSDLAAKVRLFAPPFSIQSESSPEAQGVDVFAALDRDKDGRLGRDEIAAAATSLEALDVDDDETISARELTPYRSPFVVNPAIVQGRAPTISTGSADLIVDAPPRERARKILERYDVGATRPGAPASFAPPAERRAGESDSPRSRTRDGRLDRGEIVLDREAFDRADLDGDGALDRGEIELGLATVPDAELFVRLGRRDPWRPAVEVVGPVGPRPGGVRLAELGSDGAVIDFGTTAIELRTGDNARGQLVANQRRIYLDQFRTSDSNKDGVVDSDEGRRIPLLNRLFDVADRDDDERLTEAEVTAYLDLQEEVAGLRTVLRAIDQGTSLLDLLDADRDRRIGVRELRALPEVIRREDRDGDGFVTPREVARHYRWVLSRGEVNGAVGVPIATTALAAAPAFPAPPSAPTWFLKMDRNRDGDLSPREFLGPAAAFAAYDADRDGLISPAEARRPPRAGGGP